jgi:hypothetical protein
VAREAFFSPIGSAFEWTEGVTRVADTDVSDEIYGRGAAEFREAELVALTFAVIVINSWNRLSLSFRPPVGSYQPQAAATVQPNAAGPSFAYATSLHSRKYRRLHAPDFEPAGKSGSSRPRVGPVT